MKTYVINLVVDPKNTDLYEKVALNKFPIIVYCKSEMELKEYLSNDSTKEYIKSLIKTKRVYDSSVWMIRDIYPNGNIRELTWSVSDLIHMDY
jgi:hypothetical protein